jgi:chromosome segregation ATPase
MLAAISTNTRRSLRAHEETKAALEKTQLALLACEEQRDQARGDAEKHHRDLRSLSQKYNELNSSFAEFTSKHEHTNKELLAVKQSLSSLRQEKHEWLHEKGEFEENLRKYNHKCDEYARKLEEITDKYEKKTREVHKLKESHSMLEYEKEELHQKVDELKRLVEEKHARWEDAEDRCGKWKLKWEHSEREIISLREQLRVVEADKIDLRETITKVREEIRILTVEKERLSEDYHHECVSIKRVIFSLHSLSGMRCLSRELRVPDYPSFMAW